MRGRPHFLDTAHWYNSATVTNATQAYRRSRCLRYSEAPVSRFTKYETTFVSTKSWSIGYSASPSRLRQRFRCSSKNSSKPSKSSAEKLP